MRLLVKKRLKTAGLRASFFRNKNATLELNHAVWAFRYSAIPLIIKVTSGVSLCAWLATDEGGSVDQKALKFRKVREIGQKL